MNVAEDERAQQRRDRLAVVSDAKRAHILSAAREVFAERGLDGLLVLRYFDKLADAGDIEVRAISAAGKNGQADFRSEAPRPGESPRYLRSR